VRAPTRLGDAQIVIRLALQFLELPEISGLEVTRRLTDDDRSRHIPIVAVTAFAMGWHEREALDSLCSISAAF
jgi:two-component system cell cycle response regulator DivK